MNQSKLIALLGIVLVVVLTVSSTVYTVDERETCHRRAPR